MSMLSSASKLDADTVLLELLSDERYQRDASGGLLRLSKPPSRERPWLGSAVDFPAIWSIREGNQSAGFDQARAKRYGQAIKERILALKNEDGGANTSRYMAGRIQQLAVVLAALDGCRESRFVIETLTPPVQLILMCGCTAARGLVQSGVVLALDERLRGAYPGYRIHDFGRLPGSEPGPSGRLS